MNPFDIPLFIALVFLLSTCATIVVYIFLITHFDTVFLSEWCMLLLLCVLLFPAVKILPEHWFSMFRFVAYANHAYAECLKHWLK